jgi:hypothetical protein
MNTIERYLLELPEGYREKALYNYKHHRSINIRANVINTATAITYGFVWGMTKEGSSFWSQVVDSLKAGTELPRLND